MRTFLFFPWSSLACALSGLMRQERPLFGGATLGLLHGLLKGNTLKTTVLSVIFAALLATGAHASGAVDYTCAGFEPGRPGMGPKSVQSVSFTMTGANDGVSLQILKKSRDAVDPRTSSLVVGADCKFSMVPDEHFPAYRVSVSGKCGTSQEQNFKGMCFFDL
jgi:hypothetical protein